MSQRLKYISRIKDEFDTVICGLNGVITCGLTINHNNLDALIKIYQSGKKIMLAANCGWRVADLFYFLKNSGVPMNIFYTMITAGEIAHFYLKNKPLTGNRYYSLPAQIPHALSSLNYTQVKDISDADFIVTATDAEGLDVDACQTILRQALPHRLPLLCIGNNTTFIAPNGLKNGAGAVAEQYAMMGGTIIPFGKPDIHVAKYLCEGISHFKKSRCLVIGDTMATDMRLGNSFQAKTLLVTTGCHLLRQPTPEQINRLSTEYGLNIDYYTEQLQW